MAAEAHEAEVPPLRIGHGVEVALPVEAMAGPGPGDDRLARVGGEHVGPRLPVAVPEHLTGDGALQGPAEHLAHHHGPGQVEPDDHLGARPHQIADRGVVAVDDPGVAGRRGGDLPTEVVPRELHPVGLVEDGVQLDGGHADPRGQAPGEGRLSRARVAHDRDPPHPAIVAPGGGAVGVSGRLGLACLGRGKLPPSWPAGSGVVPSWPGRGISCRRGRRGRAWCLRLRGRQAARLPPRRRRSACRWCARCW